MNIRREDLQAAAEAGVVQYKQIDQILIFLMQRDVLEQRSSMLAGQHGGALLRHVLFYLLALAVIVGTAGMAGVYARQVVAAYGALALLWFTGGYILFAVAVASWFQRHRTSPAARILATSAVALVPLAVFVLQQLA